jgi:hypothetical protein
MVTSILPLVIVAATVSSANESRAEQVVAGSPRAAQARLAEALADADSIESVTSDRGHHHVTFAIARAGEKYAVIVATGKRGVVVGVETHDVGPAGADAGSLSWLVDAMQNTPAITRLVVDEEGAVTLVTSDAQRFMAIPGRGSGGTGNIMVESRWAASWDHT